MAKIYLENILPGLRSNTIASNQPIDFSGAASVALPGSVTLAGAETITSNSATAFTVGRQGSTNPVLQVDASATTVITGVKISGAAVGTPPTISTISSGSNEGLTITSKGTGTLALKPGTDAVSAVGFYKADGTTRVLAADTTNNRLQYFPGEQMQPASGDGTNVLSFVNNAANATMIGIDSTNNRVAIGKTTPGTTLDVAGTVTVSGTTDATAQTPIVIGSGTDTITGAVTDGFTGSLRLNPTINAATSQTVTRHNYIDVKNVVLGGAGPAAVTDACVLRFDANAGTHKAVDAGTTKTSPGTVTQWVKINVNGTLAYIPSYSSKTS